MYKRLKSPLNTQIEVTSKCSHLCRHCYNFWREGSLATITPSKEAITSAEMERIVRQLSENEIFSITLTGGEPLLNIPACLTCLEIAREQEIDVNMNSNLVLLTPENASSLKANGLNSILTSILGPTPEVHDAITQRVGSLARFREGVEIARDVGIRVVANMVVSKLNIGYVRETAKVLMDLGIMTFTATKAGCPGNCSDFSDLSLDSGQLTRYLNDLCWVHQHMKMRVDILEPLPFCALSDVELPGLFTSRKCNAGVTSMTISYDGAVRPCSHLDISYGNLLKEDLPSIWSRMDSWREGSQVPQECRVCPLLSVCGGGCRAEAKAVAGNVSDLDPYCSVEKASRLSEIMGTAKSNRKIKKVTSDSKFETAGRLKLRRESFGGIACANGNKRVLLDHKGFEVVSQLQPKSVYGLGLGLDWRGLDPIEFVTGLYGRDVVNLV